uniref:Uncharacterized protein n=1 Tax=Mastacembelus armatus TaxID=205130 RepID=A0A3Q3MI61_9TELE
MEPAIGVLVSQFKTYAGSDGFSVMLRVGVLIGFTRFPVFLQNALLTNDGELNFLEFWQLIGFLASKHVGFQPIECPWILSYSSVTDLCVPV